MECGLYVARLQRTWTCGVLGTFDLVVIRWVINVHRQRFIRWFAYTEVSTPRQIILTSEIDITKDRLHLLITRAFEQVGDCDKSAWWRLSIGLVVSGWLCSAKLIDTGSGYYLNGWLRTDKPSRYVTSHQVDSFYPPWDGKTSRLSGWVGLIINGDGGCSLLPLARYKRASGSGRLVWSKGRRPLALCLHSSSELSQSCEHDDSTIKIIVVVVVRPIITCQLRAIQWRSQEFATGGV